MKDVVQTAFDNMTFVSSMDTVTFDDSGGHETVAGLDIDDIAVSDVTEPVWPSEPIDYGVNAPIHEGHSHAGLRTLSGAIDTLDHVVEESIEWIERESDGPGHAPHRKRDKPIVIAMYQRVPKSFRCNTFSVDQPKRIVEKRYDRYRLVVTNWSAGIVYLTHQSDGNALLPETNMVQVAPNGGQRVFYTSGELWAYPAVNGTAQVIDVQDEYGFPEQDY